MPIDINDLMRLSEIARIDREEFFERKPKYKVLAKRIVAVALCQGAALHYIDGKNGVKDLDVWTFFAAHPDVKFPRRNIAYDFGDSKFGPSPRHPNFIGRSVDLLGKSLNCAKVSKHEGIVSALHDYFVNGSTTTAKHLARKAVVLIEPHSSCGKIVWPPSAMDPLPV